MVRKVFTPDDPALPMNYPGFVFRKLREEGYLAEALLAGTGLEEVHLSDPDFRCGFQPLRRLLLNALEQTGDPGLGLKLGQQFQPTYIGIPAYTYMNAVRFKNGLEVLATYFSLNFPAVEFSLIEEDTGLGAEEAAVRLRAKFPFEDIEYFGFSSAIVALNGLFKSMLQRDQVATHAAMVHAAPDGWDAIETDIGFPIRFGAAENEIIFPKALLGQPLPGADPINHARLLELCEQLAAEMAFEVTPVTQVIALLEGAETLTVPLSDVASELGYSERGLRR
ncbi:MAG: AraC family transcriptional regulator ligand-binding domain-containing protein [Pseudomonadota bacterium]